MSQFANFLFEVGTLNRTPRSGFAFLGSGQQSVSEHCFRMLAAAWLLAELAEEPVDRLRLLLLVLFHDLPEARTGDFNYVYHRYDRVDEERLYADLAGQLPKGEQVVELIKEFEARVTPEAQLANEADQLEFIASLKEQLDLGNAHAADWIPPARARLRTELGLRLADEILMTPSDEWWFGDKSDRHWIDRGRTGPE